MANTKKSTTAKRKNNKQVTKEVQEVISPVEAPAVVENTPVETVEVPQVQEVVPAKSSNPRLIEWPTDRHGFTSMLKKEATRAVGRVNGHADKQEVFLATLDVIREHALVRFESMTRANEERKQSYSWRQAEAERQAEKTRVESLKKAKEQVAHLEGNGE